MLRSLLTGKVGALLLALLALLFNASIVAGYQDSPVPASPGTTASLAGCSIMLSGQVTDGAVPVPGALVRAYVGGMVRGTTTTNTNGNFIFAYPPLPGNVSFQLGVQTVGRPQLFYGPYGPFACGSRIDVGDLVYKPASPGGAPSIEGTVWFDADGNTLVGMTEPRGAGWSVALLDSTTTRTLATTFTDTGGRYRFRNLRPGSYVVGFIQPGSSTVWLSGPVNVSLVNRTVDFDFKTNKAFIRP